MVARELDKTQCRELAKQAFAEAGLDEPTSHVPYVAIQIALDGYHGGSVHTETGQDGIVRLVASAPFTNFAPPTNTQEVSEATIHYHFLRNLQAILGRPLCYYQSDSTNERSTVIIPITQDLASVS
jgi:hypothetical protein